MKNVVKVMNHHGEGFEYLRENFPKLVDAKLKEGICIGPKIREIIIDDLFVRMLTGSEKSAWLTFKVVCLDFLGNLKAENFKQLVEELLNLCHSEGCNMSLKIFFFFYIPTCTSSLRTWAQ